MRKINNINKFIIGYIHVIELKHNSDSCYFNRCNLFYESETCDYYAVKLGVYSKGIYIKEQNNVGSSMPLDNILYLN